MPVEFNNFIVILCDHLQLLLLTNFLKGLICTFTISPVFMQYYNFRIRCRQQCSLRALILTTIEYIPAYLPAGIKQTGWPGELGDLRFERKTTWVLARRKRSDDY